MSLFEQQQQRRAALVERLGTVADLACQTPLAGDLGDVAYDLLRQAAAQIASDRLHLARETTTPSQRLDAATVERCAQVAYRVCAETRHVSLADKVHAAILALATDPHQHGGKGA